MKEFFSWFPSYNRGKLETVAKLFWQLVISWFTLGILCNMSLLNLDEKEKITKKVRNIPWLGSAKKRKTKPFITVNHTIPDWVTTFLAAICLTAISEIWEPKLCKVVKAKPLDDWELRVDPYLWLRVWLSADGIRRRTEVEPKPVSVISALTLPTSAGTAYYVRLSFLYQL